MTCCPVCMWCWGGVELQHRPCDVQSCMSVGLGWGEVTTQTMRRVVLHFCGVGVGLQHRPSDGVGLSYNTNHVTCSPLSVGLGWGEVTTQTM